jgi:hypothetical protein
MSKITPIYQQLLRQARNHPGTPQHAQLGGGARIYVRVTAGEITVTFARRNAKLADRELAIFRRDCAIPHTALRLPAEGQETRERRETVEDEQGPIERTTTWYVVGYRWRKQGD